MNVPAKGAQQKYRLDPPIQGIPLRWMRRPIEMSQVSLGSSKIPDSQKQYATLDMAAGPMITSFCSSYYWEGVLLFAWFATTTTDYGFVHAPLPTLGFPLRIAAISRSI